MALFAGAGCGDGGGNDFSRTVCSICYEDLKPLVDHLQAISVCGHVFHELCLQQWFEYIPAGKRSSCPVCKRVCSNKSVSRLYFQSTSDPTQTALSPGRSSASTEELREDVKRLESKVAGLNVAYERLQQHLKELNEELSVSKERAFKEGSLKDQALKETSRVRKLLQEKVGEVSNLATEKSQLQDRCLALAKELAALKLVSDVNLDEEQITKLATLGGGGNNVATVEILQKSLLLRNLKYKELLAQCTHLGRGETLSLKKLEKSEEKIKKLKMRVQELEKALEEKDNGILRSLRAPCASTRMELDDGVDQSAMSTGVSSKEIRSTSITRHVPAPLIGSAAAAKFELSKGMKKGDDIIDLDSDTNFWNFSGSRNVAKLHKNLSIQAKVEASAAVIGGENSVPNSASISHVQSDADMNMDEAFGSDVVLISNHNLAIANLPSPFDSRDSSSVKTESSVGILGPEGGPRYLGKWCKRGLNKPPSSGKNGDLIAVGSDGRGGKIKVLRSQNPVSSGKANFLWPKKFKYGSKTSSQAQNTLQIDHYFLKKESVYDSFSILSVQSERQVL